MLPGTVTRSVMLSVAVCLAIASGLHAQTITSTIEGTISDAQGGVIVRATIAVNGSSDKRTVTTDDEGFYRVVALPAGTYTLTVSANGFADEIIRELPLVLNTNLRLDVMLSVAGRQESVNVVGAQQGVDFSNASPRQVITSQQIQSIPLNGRNYLDLVRLTPGVVLNDNARSDLADRDSRGSILGERAGNVSFLIDGAENNDDVRGGVFQSFTQDAIREFEVIQAGYKAEFGTGSGGVVNVITKSGGNDTQGSGFFFTRHDALDSSNVAGADAPELKRYNAGVVVSGPAIRDRAFFMTAYERLRETRAMLFAEDIPAVLRQGEDFSVSPELTTDRLFGKYNQHLTPVHQLTASGSWSRVENEHLPVSPDSLPSASNSNLANTFLGTASVTSILGQRLLLDHSFAYRDQRFGQNENAPDGRGFAVNFLDLRKAFLFGPPAASVVTLDQRYVTGRSVASIFPNARHAAKVGVDFTRTNVNGENGPGLTHVLITTQAGFAAYGRDSFQIPQGPSFLSPGDELTRLRNNGVSLFAQDDWRVADAVTLNLGIRYDRDSEFSDSNNVAPRVGVAWRVDSDTAVRASWGLFYDRYRLGIAGAVPEFGGFNSQTVVELNYPRLLADALVPLPGSIAALNMMTGDPFLLHRRFNIPFDAVVSQGSIQQLTGLTPAQFIADANAFLSGYGPFIPVDFSPATGYLRQDLGAAFADVIRVASPFKTPSNNTFTLGVERSLPGALTVGGTYVHREIRDILGVRLTNLAYESRLVGGAITTDGGPIQRTYGGWYDGDYDAFIVAANKRLSGRVQVQANYTYARGEDNLLNSNLAMGLATQGGGSVPTDNLDLEADRGNSDLSVRHTFVTSGVMSLPFAIDVSGVLRATSGVFFSATGVPFDYDGDGIISTRPQGTARNAFEGPASMNLDMRVEKKFRVMGRYRASMLIEGFNLTNARNARLVDSTWINGAPGPDFGSVRAPLPGRETQVGFRLEF